MGSEDTASTGDFLAAELHRLGRDVREAEAGVRGEEHDVHAMRVAARRLRAVLAAASPVLRDARARWLRDELRWLGLELSASRDAQVLGGRLAAALDPDVLDNGIAVHVDGEVAAARARAVAALDSPRWVALREAVTEVGTLALDPERAAEPATVGMARLVDRQSRRLRKARRRARQAADGPVDAALHEVRKKAKGLRYLAEVAVPVIGARAERLAVQAEEVQDVLGRHQDSVVAVERMHLLATSSGVGSEAALSLGQLAVEEEMIAARSRDEYDRLPTKLPTRLTKHALRKG